MRAARALIPSECLDSCSADGSVAERLYTLVPASIHEQIPRFHVYYSLPFRKLRPTNHDQCSQHTLSDYYAHWLAAPGCNVQRRFARHANQCDTCGERTLKRAPKHTHTHTSNICTCERTDKKRRACLNN